MIQTRCVSSVTSEGTAARTHEIQKIFLLKLHISSKTQTAAVYTESLNLTNLILYSELIPTQISNYGFESHHHLCYSDNIPIMSNGKVTEHIQQQVTMKCCMSLIDIEC